MSCAYCLTQTLDKRVKSTGDIIMRKVVMVLAAASVGVGLAQSASAADLSVAPLYKAPPPPPAFSWTGFYAGLNGGGGWGQTSHTTDPTAVLSFATGDFNTSGGLAGGTFGYNYQTGAWVIGAETDLDWADIKGTTTFNTTIAGVPASFSRSSELMWLDTTRARVGWAYDRVLFYGTAGAAFGGLQANRNVSIALLAPAAGDTETRFGWTAGGGIEWAFLNNFSAKIEYLYVDLGSQTQLLDDSVKFNVNIVRAGLNVKF
jgi:outer membrane immunogenic protein